MARRRGMGLLGLVGLAAGAWWLFGRPAGAAAPNGALAARRADVFSRARALTIENIELLKSSGGVPPDAVEVYEDPQHVGPAVSIGPGEYVVGPGGGVAGFGSLLYPTDVSATPLAPGGSPSITPGLWY